MHGTILQSLANITIAESFLDFIITLTLQNQS